MKPISPSALLFFLLLTATIVAFADSPPTNSIPIISMKTGQHETCEDITMDVLCMLLWHNFDGIWIEGKFDGDQSACVPSALCDSAKAVMVLNPSTLSSLYWWPAFRWGRYSAVSLSDTSAFIRTDTDFLNILERKTASEMADFIVDRCADLADSVSTHPCIWYLDVFNEPSAKQLDHMLSDTVYDDYFPSFYAVDTMLTDMLPDGIFSWVKWKSDSIYTEELEMDDFPSVSTTYSLVHTLTEGEWAGCDSIHLGTDTTQANSVRAYFDMQYLQYDPSSTPWDTLTNAPERLDLNIYPARLAGYDWQDDEDSISVLGSATDLWMLAHYEQYMDSSFIPAATHENGPFPINYHTQSVGRSGGRAIWTIDSSQVELDTLIDYHSYAYRRPSPGEFRMLCNIGLLRGARAVMPYCIRSNTSGFGIPEYPHAHNAGLLDENLIPFDDPYENWVYRDRPTADFYYAPPDSIPPWTAADHSQYDPLYTVPSRPILSPGDQRNREKNLVWKFGPYAQLWSSVRGTFREIAWVAPELSQLWWWFYRDLYDAADISYDGTEPDLFADPHIRVFTDKAENTCYLFYVNRFCRANDNPFEVEVDSDDFPSGTDFSEYALDHSRRFLIEGSESSNVYTFLDTLDAGQARLLQMFDDSEGLEADLRITDPDVFVVIPADGDTLMDNASTVSTGFNIYGWVYNMGTESENRVKVWLEDITTDTVRIDSVYLNFDGLSTSSCYETDRALASFDTTITPGHSDIGIHIYRIHVEPLSGEPDTLDNSGSLVYMVRPRDYATEVLDDPWDMTEAASSPPSWKTNDIASMTGWNATFTDSISGMFEGTITDPCTSNRMVLNTGTGSSDWIDTSLYENISLAGKAEMILDITVHWMDEDSVSRYVDLGVDLDTAWAEIGPVNIQDLIPSWDDKDGIQFSLEFRHPTSVSQTDVRISWIKLTE